MAYVFAGLLLWSGSARRALKIEASRRISALAVLLVVIGCMSFFYSSTLTFIGQFFDIFGMYLLGTFILYTALYRLGAVSSRQAITLFMLTNAVLAAVQYSYPEARRYLFAVILVPGIVMEFLPQVSDTPTRKRYSLFAGFGIVLVGYILWLLDQDLILCSPRSALQGHAAWHILTAGAVLLLAMHYSQATDKPTLTRLNVASSH